MFVYIWQVALFFGGGQLDRLSQRNTRPESACSQTYKSHERSREAIEFAYEAILKQDMKRRQKYGFKPPKLGRKTDLDADVVSARPPCCRLPP